MNPVFRWLLFNFLTRIDFFSSSAKMLGQHLLLKAVSLALVTPFFSVSLIESVQSDIASESPVLVNLGLGSSAEMRVPKTEKQERRNL